MVGAIRCTSAGVNSDTDEWYPTTAASGKLYFSSERAGGLGDIFVVDAKSLDRLKE